MAQAHFGYARDELLGMPIMQLLPRGALHVASGVAHSAPDPLESNPELVCIRKNGSQFPGSATFGRLDTLHGLLHTVVVVNVEDKKDTLQKLHASQHALRELAANNESTRENERKSVAREVHDELGQVMTALRMQLSLLHMQFAAHVPHLGENVDAMKALVDRAIKGVRNIATALRPEPLNLGLIPALEWLRDEFLRHNAVQCTLQTMGKPQPMDESKAMLIYRIVQESLTNVSRYTKAREVTIVVAFAQDAIDVRVSDDGCGFDLGEALIKKTFGLLGMRERALTLDGELQVLSSPGSGTTVSLKVPLYLSTEEPKP
jgi:signal transduction histidine kinase